MSKGYALITGASSGIGRELAFIFAREGYSLVLTARRKELLEELENAIRSKYPTTIELIATDISDRIGVESLISHIKAKQITPVVLVNNAGFGLFGEFTETDLKKELMMIDLNIVAPVILTKAFLPNMIRNKNGKILNIASTAAFQPGPLMSIYYASKSFVLSFSEAIAEELSGTGVTVTALCPGPTASEFQAVANMEGSRLFKSKKIPTSKEVAEYGYRSLVKNKRVAIHGLYNKTLATSTRFTPRWIVTRVVKYLQDKKKQ